MSTPEQSEQFLQVLDAHKGIIYKVANSYCNDTEERKDLIQEMSVQLWKAFASYRPEYKYSTWIYRIALNVAISFYRKKTLRRTNPISETILNIGEEADHTDTAERMFLLQKFIAGLKEIDRALMLLYLEEKSHREIADIMGISESNVSTKIGRIKLELRQKFSNLK